MTAPHFHTTKEARAAIKSVEHNLDGTSGKPVLKNGGSASNKTTTTPGVTSTYKGADHITSRKP